MFYLVNFYRHGHLQITREFFTESNAIHCLEANALRYGLHVSEDKYTAVSDDEHGMAMYLEIEACEY